MRAFVAIQFTVALTTLAFAEVPDVDAFRVVPQFPPPAAGASLVLGASDNDNGRLVVWDGDAVYYQERTNSVNGPLLEEVATGYLGDPSFVALHSNNRRVFLGSGPDALIYEIPDIRNPADFTPGTELDVVTFSTGTILNDGMLLLDRVRDDLSGAELVIVNIALARADDPNAMRAVLQKPAGSAPAAIFADRNSGRTYVMDPVSGELRSFSSSALRDAYLNSAPLSWTADGTLIGTAGQFLNGGVYGVSPDNELLIGGDTGAAGTGGIQYVDPAAPASIIDTLDPAATGPAYVLIYSRRLDEVIAIDPSVSPPDAYATPDFLPVIPPDSPCDDFDAIKLEFAAFLDAFAPAATDLDGDTIRDSAMLELLGLFACRDNDESALGFSTDTAYDDNREVFAAEANAGALAAYGRIVPVLLSMNQAMRAAVLSALSTGGQPIFGSYVTVSCTDLDACLPEFVEDPFVFARSVPRGSAGTEPYFASGDPDGDGFSNLEEFTNNEAKGGDDLDFAVAAASDKLDGTDDGLGGGGGCFIATAAYGTPLGEQLNALRGIRDGMLLRSPAGSAFADTYYRVSPAIAAWIAERPVARAAVRVALLPFVAGRAWLVVFGAMAAMVAGGMIARHSRKPAAVQRK